MEITQVRTVPLSALPQAQQAAILEARRAWSAKPFDLQAFLAAAERANASSMNGEISVIAQV